MVITDALNLTHRYLRAAYTPRELQDLCKELTSIAGVKTFEFAAEEKPVHAYGAIQDALSRLNEKESFRKKKGVYYTPNDVVQFILRNTVKSAYGKLHPENIHDTSLDAVPYLSFCTKRLVFDPTCGAGEFLLAALELKLELLKARKGGVTRGILAKTVATVHGNDINPDSVVIAKIRLFLCALHHCGSKKCRGLAALLNQGFQCRDFVTQPPDPHTRYHIIVGNPPFVEDAQCGLPLDVKYGNIYANVLDHASQHLAPRGSMGFVIPLSYCATPRMKDIRDTLLRAVPEQYILSYADRPDCLFDSVHQKLCILIAKHKQLQPRIYTGNYQYWYQEERAHLFRRTQVIRNRFSAEGFIPKLGTAHDIAIYRKITRGGNRVSVYAVSRTGPECVYLNRRETFWMKAFRTPHVHPEFKVFSFHTPGEADYCYCLIHSSLFWWYWISTSDCWHVSRDLNGFTAPRIDDYTTATALAQNLSRQLEQTKEYVGTRQTAYEYKHRKCIEEIHAIDDYIHRLYGLTDVESAYIKNFAYRYRTSGGAQANEGH